MKPPTHYLVPPFFDESGRLLPVLYPPDSLGRRIEGLIAIESDLRECRRGFSYLADHNDDLRKKGGASSDGDDFELFAARCIWLASVVGYGKCFVSAEGRRVMLQTRDVQVLGPEFVECHEKVMTDRHEYFAHGGTSLNEGIRFALGVDAWEPLKLRHCTFVMHAYLPEKKHCVTARDLCARLGEVVSRRAMEACDRWEAEVRKMTSEELRQLLEGEKAS